MVYFPSVVAVDLFAHSTVRMLHDVNVSMYRRFYTATAQVIKGGCLKFEV